MITLTFDSYDDMRQYIRTYENEHGYKFLVSAIARGLTDELTTLTRRKLLYNKADLPYLYILNGTMGMFCGLGGRKYDKHKKDPDTDPSTVTGKRKRSYKKCYEEPLNSIPPCPAEIRIQSLFYFPDYKVSLDMSKRKLSEIANNLRNQFSAKTVYKSHFVVEIDETHCNHRKKIPTAPDIKVTDMVQSLVERGYYAASDIKEKLEKYYETLPDKPDPSDPKFYPESERLRRLVYPHVMKQRDFEREKGFVENFEECLQMMADMEKDTCTSYICVEENGNFGQQDVYEAAKKTPVLLSPDTELHCRLDTGGVPYIILGTRHYECSHGVDYKTKYWEPYAHAQRRYVNKEGNVMCIARCTVREVALFPAYRIDEALRFRHIRQRILALLQEHLRDRTAPFERKIAYAFPCLDEHCGHPVREVNGHLLLDDTLKTHITELVSEGVKSISEMRRHLKMYLKHMFDEITMPGPFNRKYHPSNQTLVNLMYEAGAQPEEIVQDVGDPVTYIWKPSEYLQFSRRERGNETQTAVSNVSNRHGVETQYGDLVESLEKFQTENNACASVQQNLTATPTKRLKSPTATSESPQKFPDDNTSSDNFSSTVFKKQSECQTLLEEMLQTVYQLSDLLRLRDLQELLKRVNACLKKGKLLCNEIQLNRKQAACTNIQDNDGNQTIVTEGDVESSEEPPTKLLIMDQNEQMTEVDVSSAHKTDEIVIYEGTDQMGTQFIVVNQESDTIEDKNNDDGKTSLDNKQRENVKRKDWIKVTCKEYFSKEQILKMLNISEKEISKLENSSRVTAHSSNYNLGADIKDLEKEMNKLEKDKISLSVMENDARQKEICKQTPNSRERSKGVSSRQERKKKQTSVKKSDTQKEAGDVSGCDEDADDSVWSCDENIDTEIHEVNVDLVKSSPPKGLAFSSTQQTKQENPTDKKTPSLESGDSVKIPPARGSNVSPGQLASSGLVSINNIIHTQTPLGFLPVLNSAGKPIVIGKSSLGSQSNVNGDKTQNTKTEHTPAVCSNTLNVDKKKSVIPAHSVVSKKVSQYCKSKVQRKGKSLTQGKPHTSSETQTSGTSDHCYIKTVDTSNQSAITRKLIQASPARNPKDQQQLCTINVQVSEKSPQKEQSLKSELGSGHNVISTNNAIKTSGTSKITVITVNAPTISSARKRQHKESGSPSLSKKKDSPEKTVGTEFKMHTRGKQMHFSRSGQKLT